MGSIPSSSRFLSAQPDERLVQLIREGHERAFDTLVGRYERQLFACCLRLTGTHGAAEDALQQTLLLAWSAIRSGVEVRDLSAWLHRIAHNVAISNLRRAAAATADIGIATAPHGEGPDQEFERRVAIREALAGLAALPETQRRVLLASVLEGRSHEELASALGVTSAAVRGLVYRARSALRTAAAALMPWPLIPAAGASEGAAAAATGGALGGGGAGIAGLLLKGGAVVLTAGTIASAAGLLAAPGGERLPAHRAPFTHHKPRADARLPTRSSRDAETSPRRARRSLTAATRFLERRSNADPAWGRPRIRRFKRAQLAPARASGAHPRSRAERGHAPSGSERPRGEPHRRRGGSRDRAWRVTRSRVARSQGASVRPGTAHPQLPKRRRERTRRPRVQPFRGWARVPRRRPTRAPGGTAGRTTPPQIPAKVGAFTGSG